jgi:hypothetical protein
MDLKRELLAVLDNPVRIWDSIVQNLSNESRICLMTLATTTPPIDLIDWQRSVALVSTETAVVFEASIRSLDDNFVDIRRDRSSGKATVTFLNPSIEEFCAGVLDRNAGFATSVSTHNPSLEQIMRIIQLGTAGAPRQPTYGNIHTTLIKDPSVLIERLFALMAETPTAGSSISDAVRFSNIVTSVVKLLGGGRLEKMPNPSKVRTQLIPTLLGLSFDATASLLFKLLDDRQSAQTLVAVLADRFTDFYEGLVESASAITHFDSLMNFDESLGRPGTDASWADKFHSLNESWLDEGGDSDTIQSNRDYYERIADHLDLDDLSGLGAWDDAVEEAGQDVPEPDDDSWQERAMDEYKDRRRDAGDGGRAFDSLRQEHAETSRIDALFSGLAESKSRE